MSTQALPYTVLDLLGALLAGAMAVVSWRRRHSPGGFPLAVAAVFALWWCLWNGLSLAASTYDVKALFLEASVPGRIGTPWAVFMFALQYTRNERRSPLPLITLAAIDSLFGTVALWINPGGLFWSPYLDTAGSFPVVAYTSGPLLWVTFAPAYAAVLVSVGLMVRVALVNRGLFRWQAALLLAGSLLPVATGAMFETGHSPIRNLNLSPFSLALAASLVTWAIFGHRLLDLVPIAQSMIIDSISDAVILLDVHDRVIYLNRAAQVLVGASVVTMGQTLGAAFGDQTALLARSPELDQESRHVTLVWGRPERTFDVVISPLRDKAGQAQGRALVLRDVTPRQLIGQLQHSRHQIIAAEEHVRQQIAEMLQGTVQSKLLALSSRLGDYQEHWGGSDAESKELLTIREAIERVSEQDVRRASLLLHPSIIRFGLLPAVRELADGFRPVFAVELTADPPSSLETPLAARASMMRSVSPATVSLRRP